MDLLKGHKKVTKNERLKNKKDNLSRKRTLITPGVMAD